MGIDPIYLENWLLAFFISTAVFNLTIWKKLQLFQNDDNYCTTTVLEHFLDSSDPKVNQRSAGTATWL